MLTSPGHQYHRSHHRNEHKKLADKQNAVGLKHISNGTVTLRGLLQPELAGSGGAKVAAYSADAAAAKTPEAKAMHERIRTIVQPFFAKYDHDNEDRCQDDDNPHYCSA